MGTTSSSLRANDDRPLQWSIFLLVMLCSWHGAWKLNQSEPYEFLRKLSDNLAYYQYLPALFVDGNFDRMPWVYVLENGKGLSLVTLGVALLQLPFYLLGHVWANAFGYNLDGYSPPFAVANMLSTAVYTGLGCVLAYRLARRYADEVSALTAVVLLFAVTNLFYYAVYEPGYSHAYSFFLIGWVCWSALRVQEEGRVVHVFSLVVATSLMLLVRQLNVFVLAFPLIAGAGMAGGLRQAWRNVVARRTALLVAMLLALLPWLLQMVYWHHITGEAFTFAYGKKGEHFEWDKMVPGLVLFSHRNGWLVYSPFLIPVLAALLLHAVRRERAALGVLAVVTVTWLFYSAWWCWWLGTSFGARGMVDLYGLLAIPCAWLVRAAMLRGFVARAALALFTITCAELSFGMMARFNWLWSWHTWNWQKFFYEVSLIASGAD